MLISYQAVVKEGQIQLQDPVDLPEGTEVLVVVLASEPELTEDMEDEALNRAMDEARDSPLLTREQAIAYLDE